MGDANETARVIADVARQPLPSAAANVQRRFGFFAWFCSEPRLARNQKVVLRYPVYLEPLAKPKCCQHERSGDESRCDVIPTIR
jgi:hypothetical protein